ncbi:mitotic interactor and substrate of PLK1-like isoform X2 [Heterodontus francisci]|uniref:mitotic interactor and substrate of PLK1-like isoform X2 n=1 Tax=Heterodontus francisci TaxID=7792 RepID=UPI00355AFC84
MFKYTHPWQALCQIRDQRIKTLGTLGIPIEASAVNEVESQQGAPASKDLVHSSLPNSGTQPIGIPEGTLVQSKDSEQDRAPSKDTREILAGSRDQLEEQANNELVLKEEGEKETVFPKDPQTPTETEDSLGEEPPIQMERTEGNAFTAKNGSLVSLDGSYPGLENGTHLFSHNSNTITVSNARPSVSVTPASGIDCGNDVIIHAKKVAVIQHQEPDSQNISVNGGLIGMFSSTTDHEEGCTPSAVRDAKLATIKREANFDLRTYHAEKVPTRLFSDNKEGKYQTVIIKGTADDKMLAKERREIIRNQAMKKNATIAEKWGSTEQLDMGEKPLLEDSMQQQDKTWMSSVEANSYSFLKESSIAYPESIDTEQINFTTARQQFLDMEKSRQEVPMSPRLSAQPYKVLNCFSSLSESAQPHHYEDTSVLDTSPVVTVKAGRVDCIPDGEKRNTDNHSRKSLLSNSTFTAEKIATLENGDDKKFNDTQQNLPVCSSIDDLDSGLGEMSNDYCFGFTSDGGASNEMLNIGTDNSGVFEFSEQKPVPETPIEKEIRLAMEREESLRKERGIRNSGSSEEMVQIRTKPLLSQLPPTSPFAKSKDKNRMVFFVQREIEMDSKREEKLRQEGKVKGLYDKGVPQEVEKRKKVFEQQVDDVPVAPQQGRRPKLASFASQESLDVYTIPEESNTIQVDATECKVILQECPEYQLHTTSTSKISSSKLNPVPCSTATRLVESQITPNEEPYILRPFKSQTTLLIEREIEEEQRREEELRAQRLRQQPAGSLSSTRASTSESRNSTVNLVLPGQTSTISDGNRAKGLPEMMQSQEWWKGKPWEKKEESSYAGIEASDDVNIEVLESTRVTRRMSAMAQRWEAGIFNNYQEE